jgi:hypothetical protein
MFASPFEICLMNLCQLLPKQSLYYQTREEAYNELKLISNEDYGYDITQWEEWGRNNNQFLPGWAGLPPTAEDPKSGSS